MYKVTKQLEAMITKVSIIWSIIITMSCGVQKITPNMQNHCVSVHDSVLNRTVYTKSNQIPVYGTNSSDFLRFFSKMFYYPIDQKDFQGKVILEFIVDDKGNISNCKIYNKNEKDYSLVDKEALRVLKLSSPWTPAKCNRKSVWFRMKVPVIF